MCPFLVTTIAMALFQIWALSRSCAYQLVQYSSMPRAKGKPIESMVLTIYTIQNLSILSHRNCPGSISKLGVEELMRISHAATLLHAKSEG